MKRFLLLAFTLYALGSGLLAQNPVTSADLYLSLRKLNTLGSVLYVAAHPDDENTRLLTYFSKDKLYRTGYLSLTRGDGGQNLIGNEQGIELGLIRTQELLSARRIDGAEQFFTRAYDFGFSKNPEETFTKWDREKVLSDVVWVIRKFQPDVLITRFPTTGEGGHGHHTASAILANEAFTAAADPKRFPEQLQWVRPWQAKRILWNTFNFGNNNTQRPDQFTFDVGGYNPVLGKSYGEIAAESRSQHKSQGFGVARSRGEALEYFVTTGGAKPASDLFEEVDATWNRVKNGPAIAAQVQKLIDGFDFLKPQATVPGLVELHKSISRLEEAVWKQQKLAEVEQLIGWCSGIWLEAATTSQDAVQGDSLRVSFTVNNRSGADIRLQRISMDAFDSTLQAALPANRNLQFTKTVAVASDKPLSQPYWLKEKMTTGMFVINDQQLIGQPDIHPAFPVRFDLLVQGVPISFNRPVQYRYTDPVKGELYQPVFVVAPLSIYSAPNVLLFPAGQKMTKNIQLQVAAHKKISARDVLMEARSASNYLSKRDTALNLDRGAEHTYNFTVTTADLSTRETDQLQAMGHYKINGEKKDAYHASTSIRYDHIPTIRYYYMDHIKLLRADLKTSGKRVGYIPGAGDKVPEALEQMGYEVVMLGDKELARLPLQQFDAILTGVRAYNTNEWMNHHYEKLMAYVHEGGNLIVQYNTSSGIGPVRAKMGPYPFNISRNRVTNEEAPVSFLKPEHPVLNYPNKITAADFNGWMQERSIYHASELDKNFETVLGISDPGETSDNASLVVARYGKGYFTYTGLVFFRQLPAGVTGAYRLMANLIALNHKKEF